VGSPVLIKEKRAQEAAAVAYANAMVEEEALRGLQSKNVLKAVAHRLASHSVRRHPQLHFVPAVGNSGIRRYGGVASS
jgi:hypothetical protein